MSSTHKRRSHNKSRKGCINCKKRHVKCDEQGPPCAACVARDTTATCSYEGKRQSPIRQEPTPAPSSTDFDLSSRSGTSDAEESETRRLLELKLMHRWMTHTWKCLHGMDEDVEFLLEQLPQACLKYDYLLHATHALCATDLAIHGDNKALQAFDKTFYLATALSYYDSASQALRPQLAKVHHDSQVWLYMASVMLTMIQMSLPQCMPLQPDEPQPTTIERLGLIIDLFTGNGKVALADWFSFNAGPGGGMVQSAIRLVAGPPPTDIDPSLQSVLDNMRAVLSDSLMSDSELNAPQYHAAYTRVSKLLELSLIEEARGQIQGMVVSVPMYCGRDFFNAVIESQPTALFLLIIFGALVERGARSGYWWANQIGPGLVTEATETIARTQPHLLLAPHWQQVLAWASAEAGVPVLV